MAVDENTIAFNERFTEGEKIAAMKLAKGGSWLDEWKPYCTQMKVACDSRLTRMEQMSYGFRCRFCGNMVGWNLRRLVESPLNEK